MITGCRNCLSACKNCLLLPANPTWAFVRNHLNITIGTLDEAAPVHHAGHTLTILRKDASGRWLLARDANLVAAKS